MDPPHAGHGGYLVGAVLIFRVSSILLLAFGGVLVAVAVRSLSDFVQRHTPMPSRWALCVTVVALFIILAALGWLLGDRIAEQLNQLWQHLPETLQAVREDLGKSPLGQALPDLGSLAGGQGSPLRQLGTLTTSTLGGLTDLLVMLFIGLYLATDPEPYRRGFLKLVPPSGRERLDNALDAVGKALRAWLLGKVIAMIAMGVLTSLGLWMLGVPLALSLGIIAGLCDFVPYVGPIIAAIPAVLIAFAQEPIRALYVALLYLTVQQIEGNIISPLLQRRMVNLQPALLIFAIVSFGVVFGFLGVLFGAPLTVVTMVLVQKLYVEGALGDASGGANGGLNDSASDERRNSADRGI